MDFNVFCLFQGRMITIVIDDMVFNDSGYEAVISIIDKKDNAIIDYAEEEFIEVYPKAEELIEQALDYIIIQHNKKPFLKGNHLIIL